VQFSAPAGRLFDLVSQARVVSGLNRHPKCTAGLNKLIGGGQDRCRIINQDIGPKRG
jgi:hypothetical protein